MLSVYWTPLRHSLMSRACCATRVTIPFGGALCNGDEVYHLCILWQRMGLWAIFIFMYGITTLFISSKLTKITSSHLYPWMNHVNYNEIAFEFGSWMHRKTTPLHWCFPTNTDTELSRTLGPHGLYRTIYDYIFHLWRYKVYTVFCKNLWETPFIVLFSEHSVWD